jgi:ankyrin repeat protein
VEQLLEHGFGTVDERDGDSFTALHHAAMAGQTAVAGALLRRGADLAAESAALDSPLHLACLGGHVETAALLLDGTAAGCGAAINCTNRDGWTPLHLAVLTGQLEGNQKTALLLLERSCAVDMLSYDGWSDATHKGISIRIYTHCV